MDGLCNLLYISEKFILYIYKTPYNQHQYKYFKALLYNLYVSQNIRFIFYIWHFHKHFQVLNT